MPKIIDTLGTPDKHGVYHINQNTPGCPHCNHIDVKFDPTGKIALWHPGAECCQKRIQDQIRWRRTEIAANEHKPNYDLQSRKDELTYFGEKLTQIRQRSTPF